MRQLMPTDRTTMRRKKDRGRYDVETIHAILDEGIVCHVGFAIDGQPWMIPTARVRIDDSLFLHGATGNHALRALATGVPACVTVTLVDGLVLARSAFHHSINYRSVVIFGSAERVESVEQKAAVLHALVEHLVPGRTTDARPPTTEELRSTLVVRIPIDEASAKVRTGGPVDEPDDMTLSVWAGVIPLSIEAGTPLRDDDVAHDVENPAYATAYRRNIA
jgi:nitroimidazol reductase NimA-like FMN-containing flavoprotein (pyridoxamine 5'-phosphate oxidase superfamily)